MCGRYAASRRAEDLVLEFEAVRADGQAALPADYNVAPTKDVLRRPAQEGARRRGRAHRRRAPRAARRPLGAGAVLGQGRVGRQPDAQRPGRVAHREAGVQEGRRRPAAAWSRPTAGTSGPSGWTRRASSRTSSPRRTARCWPSPGSGRCGAAATTGSTPARSSRRRPSAALTEIHERMPLVLPPDRWAAWLDPAREDVEELAAPDAARGRGGAGAAAGEHRGQQRGEQRAGAAWPARRRSALEPRRPARALLTVATTTRRP